MCMLGKVYVLSECNVRLPHVHLKVCSIVRKRKFRGSTKNNTRNEVQVFIHLAPEIWTCRSGPMNMVAFQ